MPLKILSADITTLKVDAIVNAANTELQAGGGVCGAIFRAAGYRELQTACDKLAPIQTGEAVITPGFNLPAKFIIHTAGPIWHGGHHGEENLLPCLLRQFIELCRRTRLEERRFPAHLKRHLRLSEVRRISRRREYNQGFSLASRPRRYLDCLGYSEINF